MAFKAAAECFHNRNYTEAAELLKKSFDTTPVIQHNQLISEYYTKSNSRSHTKSLLSQLNNLSSSSCALLFNRAELHLNRNEYTKSVKIFKKLIDSNNNVPVLSVASSSSLLISQQSLHSKPQKYLFPIMSAFICHLFTS